MVDGWRIATNNSWHKGGRIWILWNPTIFLLDFYEFSAKCINMKVTEVASTTQFFVSIVYAFNDLVDRRSLWNQLINFASVINGPWMAAGEFNCVLSHTERLSGTSTDAEIDEFQSCLDACGLVDSPSQGAYYTWNNKQDASTRVFSKLDRGTKMFQVVRKLKILKVHLRQFNKDHFADIENAAALALRNLEAIQTKLIDDPSNLQMLIMETQAAEEYKKLQVDYGDYNSKYFHGVIRSRVIRNQVLSVKDTKGQEHSAPQAVKEAFLKYYKELLGTAVHTDKEIKAAIFSIPDHKAPGPDDYSSAFFKDSWTVIGDEVCAAVQDVFNSGKLLKQLNATTITLISKCKMPTYVHQFRPIACCNILYKLIMECVSSATYTLSLNEDNIGFFPGKRGLRQGDPMSPLLFTLCMEYLTRIIDCAFEKLSFHFHPLGKPMRLTHLMFVDDLLLFCKGNAQSIMVLLRAYESFSRGSGLKMNPQKSCAYFNGVPSGLKKDILSVSGIKEGTLPFKYLGVPITAGRLKKSDCGVLIDKIVERIRCLEAKKLSFAGRLVLVKAVLSTMSSYWASLFVLPKGVINRVDAICRNFLWEGCTEHNKAPLLAWYKVCVPQKEGGLGLRVSSIWNIATIAKLVWWLLVKPDKLDTIKEGFSDGVWSIGVCDYSVKSCYSWLREKRPVVDRHISVWNAVSPPKHCFVAWLIASHALMLKEKLAKLKISTDDKCCICALATESHAHLFQECSFSHKIYSSLAMKLGARLDATNQLQCIRKKRWSRLRKQVTTAILLAAWYLIWNQRNEARLFFKVSRPELIAEQAWRAIHTRIRVLSPKFINDNDKLWLSRVHLM
ncbi:uncharacterized protein LOC141648624 [Silene latifolia]|uniref:uncharacterized protein LOC141648624 n=1 Tax=Silene latifolia TaxID=37657 RepID=UPI003D76FB59